MQIPSTVRADIERGPIPGTVFPAMPDPPTGWVSRITVDRVGGSQPAETDG